MTHSRLPPEIDHVLIARAIEADTESHVHPLSPAVDEHVVAEHIDDARGMIEENGLLIQQDETAIHALRHAATRNDIPADNNDRSEWLSVYVLPYVFDGEEDSIISLMRQNILPEAPYDIDGVAWLEKKFDEDSNHSLAQARKRVRAAKDVLKKTNHPDIKPIIHLLLRVQEIKEKMAAVWRELDKCFAESEVSAENVQIFPEKCSIVFEGSPRRSLISSSLLLKIVSGIASDIASSLGAHEKFYSHLQALGWSMHIEAPYRAFTSPELLKLTNRWEKLARKIKAEREKRQCSPEFIECVSRASDAAVVTWYLEWRNEFHEARANLNLTMERYALYVRNVYTPLQQGQKEEMEDAIQAAIERQIMLHGGDADI